MTSVPDCIALELEDPVFQGHELEVWRVDLDASQEPPEEAVADLDPDERARLGRYLQVGDRARFACLRAALRQQLGARLGTAPRAVPIRLDASGKPRLPDDALWFSVAHSGDHGLLAISAGAPVGIDLEQARRVDRLDALADLILSHRERVVWSNARAEDRQALFLRAWTAKEAVLKAAGTGLLGDPRELTLLADDGVLSAVDASHRLGFDLAGVVARSLAVLPGYAAALALSPCGDTGGLRESDRSKPEAERKETW